MPSSKTIIDDLRRAKNKTTAAISRTGKRLVKQASEIERKAVKAASDKMKEIREIPVNTARNIAYKIASSRGEGGAGSGAISPINTIKVLLRGSKEAKYNGFHTFDSRHKTIAPSKGPDILRIFLCLDKNTLPASLYKPSKVSRNISPEYFSIKPWSSIAPLNHRLGSNYIWSGELLSKLLILKKGEVIYPFQLTYKTEDKYKYATDSDNDIYCTNVDLGSFVLSFGKDDRGAYMSVYDIWDFGKNTGGTYGTFQGDGFFERHEPAALGSIGKPIPIYDRYYLSVKDIRAELTRRTSEMH